VTPGAGWVPGAVAVGLLEEEKDQRPPARDQTILDVGLIMVVGDVGLMVVVVVWLSEVARLWQTSV
jgi:biotin transporter BioY